MLILGSALIDEMIAHAREHHPIEACGIIAGTPGTDRPTRLIRMRNVLESPVAYQFDPAEQMAVFRQMDERGEDPIVIYHSHTASRAYPSGTDTRFALECNAHYMIVSTAMERVEVRSWHLGGAPDSSWTGPTSIGVAWSEEGVTVEDQARRWQWPSVSAYLASGQPQSSA